MRTKDVYCGTLLRLERLNRNLGQKEVCRGICVVSYLSKIENHQVQPDAAIINQLFNRLGISYCSDADFVRTRQNLIDAYFDQLFYGLERKAREALLSDDQQLSFSPLALDWLLVKAHEGELAAFEQLKNCVDLMTAEQFARFCLIRLPDDEISAEKTERYQKAFRILNNSYSLGEVIRSYYVQGQYDKVHELAETCIALALEEGNTLNLALCYQLRGDAYACQNMDQMMLPYYRRAINLLQNTLWTEPLEFAWYNMGATYLTNGKYDLALSWLNKVSSQPSLGFLLPHKKALTYIRSGQIAKARPFLTAMGDWIALQQIEGCDVSVEQLMLRETEWETETGFLADPEFLALLEKLMILLKEKRHKGYRLFYRNILKETYCSQRKYKQALKLSEELS